MLSRKKRPTVNIEIKDIAKADWREFRRIRLTALQESPYAFGGTYLEESKLEVADWKERVGRYVDDPDTVFLLCSVMSEFVGMAGCYRDKEKTDCSHIYSVWLKPDVRGQGIAEKMVAILEGWSRENGISVIEGHVTEVNNVARAFYKKQGYKETSTGSAIRWDPGVKQVLIRKTI